MNKVFITSFIVGFLGLSVLGGYFGGSLQKPEPINLGTASNQTFIGSIFPIGTSTLNHEIGTTSESGDRVFFRQQVAYGTSTSVDIYDELKVGRSATTTITEGTITTTDLTVTGTCTGCSGASTADLQDAYNNSAADATILSADGKELVYIIADTTDPGHFLISAASQGYLGLGVGSTTNGVWHGYGALGIGTTSPGGGLAVNATSTVLSGIAYVLDHLKTSFLIATSTTASSTLPELTSTNITTAGLRVTGDLNVDNGTSTLQGATFGGLFTTNGINVSTGDLLLTAGVLKISSTGTSTNAGTEAVNSTTGTSTNAGNLEITKNLRVGSVTHTVASSTNVGTTTITADCAFDITDAVMDRDGGLIFKNCESGEFGAIRIMNPRHEAGADHQLNLIGVADSNGEYGSSSLFNSIWIDKTAGSTSTPGYICQGYYNILTFTIASSTDNQGLIAVLDPTRCYGY